jgi:DNA-binding transcriptional LysR family regulator
LTRRDADVALRTARPTHGDYVIRQAGTWKCALYVSKALARELQYTPGTNALPDVDMVTWTEEHRFRGGDWVEKNAPKAPVALAANSRHVQYAACKAGLGAAVLPCVAADDDPDLVKLLPAERVRSVPMWLVAHRDLLRTARVRAVMDFIVDIAPR